MRKKQEITQLKRLQSCLFEDGWRTPNTYGNDFAMPEREPGVYLFLMGRDLWFHDGLVAYVGMSRNLVQRLSAHPTRAEIDSAAAWVSTWFKTVPVCDLRNVERQYIRQFDPPWNIIGRKRGMAA